MTQDSPDHEIPFNELTSPACSYSKNKIRRLWFYTVGLGIAAFFLSALAQRPRVFIVALDANQAEALCARQNYSLSEFWARAQAMEVGGMLLRPDSLDSISRRGRLFGFAPGEFEKWKALGLIAPGSALKPNSLGLKDIDLYKEIIEAAHQDFMSISTFSYAGYHWIQFPSSLVWAPLKVYDMSLRPPNLEMPIFYDGILPRQNDFFFAYRLSDGSWLGLRQHQSEEIEKASFPSVSSAQLVGAFRYGRSVLGSPLGSLLRTAYAFPNRLVEIIFPTDRPVAESLDLLRQTLVSLRENGVVLGAAQGTELQGSVPHWRKNLGLLWIWFWGLIGPLLAMRFGLIWFQNSREWAKLKNPIVSPVFQVAAGILAIAFSSFVFALAARFGIDPAGGLFAPPVWSQAIIIAPFIIGVFILYRKELLNIFKKLNQQATYRGIIGVAAAIVLTLIVLQPRQLLAPLGQILVLPDFENILGFSRFWWVSWHWREILFGFPGLFLGFLSLNSQLDCPDCEIRQRSLLGSPRIWFLLGLLAPCEMIRSLALFSVPIGLEVFHELMSIAFGMIIGALILAIAYYFKSLCVDTHGSPKNT